ncbi:MFS transporter [Coraliomargarita parva]|uniref:MFS transporter n=1 Tax=Coraliomargarita parva TaxID=3014050 RepID=UPI0022B34F0F|nr:MFS transporter [Coraliomargarita parva]
MWVQSSRTRRNLRYSSIDAIFSTPWSLLSLPGSFLMAGLLNAYFQIGPFWFGLLCAMPALANALQIVMVPFIARYMAVRDFTLCHGWMNLGIWLSGLVGIAFIPRDNPDLAGWFFTCLFALGSTTLSLLVMGWTAWVGDFVPVEIRGRYMGRRNRFASIATLSFMCLSILMLELLDASRIAYIILVAVAVFARMAAMYIQHLIQSPDPTGGQVASANWAKELSALKEHKPLMRFVCYGMASGFFMAGMGALVPIYALDQLGASPAQFTSFSIAGTISGALGVRLWGEMIDRHGAVPIMLISFIAWRIGDMGWLFITPDALFWMYPMWISGGLMAIGYLLGSFNLLLKLIPKHSRTAGISLNLTVTSIAATIAPILIGWILNKAGQLDWNIPLTYRCLMAICLTGCLLSTLIIRGIKEPQTKPELNTIQGAMRTIRQLTVNQGLNFISNASFIVRRKR